MFKKEIGECELCGIEFETENADYAYCSNCENDGKEKDKQTFIDLENI